MVLEKTPFYAEGGGQIGDHGELIGERGRLLVEDTQRAGDAIVHIGKLEGALSAGDAVNARVDEERRWGAARNHTATHLLHRALRESRSRTWTRLPDGRRLTSLLRTACLSRSAAPTLPSKPMCSARSRMS